MAIGRKQTQYPVSASNIGDNDIFDVSRKISTSPDIYESQKLPGSVFKGLIGVFFDTYANWATKKAGSLLTPGQLIFISDRDVFLTCLSSNSFSQSGIWLSRNPVYVPSGNLRGQWYTGMPAPTVGNIYAYNQFHWRNLTGVVGTTPTTDAVNWVCLGNYANTLAGRTTRTDASYSIKYYTCTYSFSDDYIDYAEDEVGNKITGNNPLSVLYFQWGNPTTVYGCNAPHGSVIFNINNRGYLFDVTLTSAAQLTADLSSGLISNCVFNGEVTAQFGDSGYLSQCIFNNKGFAIILPSNANYSGKVAGPGLATFDETYDVTGITSLSLSLNTREAVGVVNITSSNPAETISTITNLSNMHPVRINTGAVAVTFNYGTGANQIITKDSANALIPVKGWIILEKRADGFIYEVDRSTFPVLSPRVTSITTSATPTINVDSTDAFNITALSVAITGITITGTPVNFQKLIIKIKDDGLARAITMGTSFIPMGVAVPTTTIANKVLIIGCLYDSATAKFGVVAVNFEA